MNRPLVTVIVPTYKRCELLKRALQSVLDQTCRNWELVVSDDEAPPGQTWAYLQQLAQTDARVKVFRNEGAHGQAGNVNNALAHAGGEWIKPLFDDDVLLPDCLERMVQAVGPHPTVVLAGCLARRYRGGVLVRTEKAPARKTVEIVRQPYAHLALYLQDFECGSMPTQMLIHRRAIDQGAYMVDDEAIRAGVDQRWFSDILKYGDRLHLALPLVEEHQGVVATQTSTATEQEMDDENILLRKIYYSGIPLDRLHAPPLQVVEQMTWGIRGLHRLFKGRLREGFLLLRNVRSAEAARLVAKWLLRKAFPGHFGAVPRERFDLE